MGIPSATRYYAMDAILEGCACERPWYKETVTYVYTLIPLATQLLMILLRTETSYTVLSARGIGRLSDVAFLEVTFRNRLLAYGW